MDIAKKLMRSSAFILGSIPFFFVIIVIPLIIKGISQLMRNQKLKELSINMSYELTKKWYKFIFLCFGIQFEVETKNGEKNYPEKFIICSNHRSFLDIPSITLAFPQRKIRFLAKEEVFSYPVIGWGMRIQEHPMVRKKLSVKTIKEPLELIKKSFVDTLCIFPEGTRGDGKNPPDSLLPFKEGVSFLVDVLHLPVIPVAIVGTHEIMPPGKVVPSPGKIKVIIGDIIKPEKLEEKVISIQPGRKLKTEEEKQEYKKEKTGRRKMIAENLRTYILSLLRSYSQAKEN